MRFESNNTVPVFGGLQRNIALSVGYFHANDATQIYFYRRLNNENKRHDGRQLFFDFAAIFNSDDIIRYFAAVI